MKRRVDERAMSVAGDAAAHALSTISGTLDRAGERARRTAMVVRDRLHDGSVAVARGERYLRTAGIRGLFGAVGGLLSRHKAVVAGAAGATAGMAAIAAVRARARARRRAAIRAPAETRPGHAHEPVGS